jgi:transcriptional regulator with XRE-family HTH domain
LGLTQAGLGAEAGVSLATVQNVEAGVANPSLGTLRALFGPLGLGLRAEGPAADWDQLARFGVPLLARGGTSSGAFDATALRRQVELAALELAEEGGTPDRERKVEGLAAWLLALHLHFPRVYEAWFSDRPRVTSLLPTVITGRLIQLSRIARQALSEVL